MRIVSTNKINIKQAMSKPIDAFADSHYLIAKLNPTKLHGRMNVSTNGND